MDPKHVCAIMRIREACMRKVRFVDLPEDNLFWLSRSENPTQEHEFIGPYKKRVYKEMKSNHPETVYTRQTGSFLDGALSRARKGRL